MASSYTPLVQRGTTDFKTKFAPTSPLLAIEDGEVILPSVVGETYLTHRRVFVPPGTKTLQMTMYTFASPPESKVLMRFGSPPIGTSQNVTPENAAAVDSEQIVQLLTANYSLELPFSSPASAGSVILSSRSGVVQTVLTEAGGWLYINPVQLPGDRIWELNTRVTVDEAYYRDWYANTQWDSDGNPVEDVIHTRTGVEGSSGGGGGGGVDVVLTPQSPTQNLNDQLKLISARLHSVELIAASQVVAMQSLTSFLSGISGSSDPFPNILLNPIFSTISNLPGSIPSLVDLPEIQDIKNISTELLLNNVGNAITGITNELEYSTLDIQNKLTAANGIAVTTASTLLAAQNSYDALISQFPPPSQGLIDAALNSLNLASVANQDALSKISDLTNILNYIPELGGISTNTAVGIIKSIKQSKK